MIFSSLLRFYLTCEHVRLQGLGCGWHEYTAKYCVVYTTQYFASISIRTRLDLRQSSHLKKGGSSLISIFKICMK